MDDVITDCLGGLVKEWNKQNGTSFTRTDVTKWDIESCLGIGARDIFFQKGFFENLEEKNGAIAVIQKLIESTRYDIFIVTACQSVQEIEEKIVWLQKHIPGYNLKRFIACREKHMIRGDILIDDRAENLHACHRFMDCIIYDMPHNSDTMDYHRIHGLEEVPDLLEQKFYQ